MEIRLVSSSASSWVSWSSTTFCSRMFAFVPILGLSFVSEKKRMIHERVWPSRMVSIQISEWWVPEKIRETRGIQIFSKKTQQKYKMGILMEKMLAVHWLQH